MLTIEKIKYLTHFDDVRTAVSVGMLVSHIDDKESLGVVTEILEDDCANVLWSIFNLQAIEAAYVTRRICNALKIPVEFVTGEK